VQVRDVLDPLVDLLRVLAFAALDLLDGGSLLCRLLGDGTELQIQN